MKKIAILGLFMSITGAYAVDSSSTASSEDANCQIEQGSEQTASDAKPAELKPVEKSEKIDLQH